MDGRRVRGDLCEGVERVMELLIANSDGESVGEPLVIRGEQLERVKEFVYLGSTLTEKGGSVTEIERRINLGYYKFNDMKKSIWNQSDQGANLPGNSVVNGTIRS